MRVIVREERPQPGALLRITDIDGLRVTAFVPNTSLGWLADLKLRHLRRGRCEDCVRAGEDSGMANFPLHDFAQHQIWCASVALASDLTAWTETLALTGHEATSTPAAGSQADGVVPARWRLAALKHSYLAACCRLGAGPESRTADMIRDLLVVARDAPARSSIELSQVAADLGIGRIDGAPLGPPLALMTVPARDSQELTEAWISLAGTVLIRCTLPDVQAPAG
jgi:hypothetical protein